MEVDLIGNLALPTGLRSDMLGALDRASLEAHDLVLRGVDLVRSFMRRTQARIFVVVGDGVVDGSLCGQQPGRKYYRLRATGPSKASLAQASDCQSVTRTVLRELL